MFRRVHKTVQSSTRETKIGKKEKRKKKGIVIEGRERKEDY